MKFSKLWILAILCFILLLSACSKDEPIKDDVNSNSESEINEEEKFMDEFNLSLTGKEVQYNLANNLDKDFFLNGIVEICDYYNYGFTNEKKFFCGKMITEDNETWYLYFNRTTFESVYDYLLDGNLAIMVSAIVPSSAYQSNQGNMAAVKVSQMYNPNEDD